MNDDLTPIEEQSLDAFLAETLGKAGPPDISPQVLAQFDENTSSSRAPARRSIAVAITTMAALAASVLLVIWLRSDGPRQESAPLIAAYDSTVTEPPAAVSEIPSPQIDSDQRIAKAPPAGKPPRGIPLVLDRPTDSDRQDTPPADIQTEPPSSPASPAPPPAVTLVSKQVDAELRSYWNAIGIEPTSSVGADAAAARLSDVLAIELSVDSILDPEQLQVELSQVPLARAIALRWLRQITEQGAVRLDKKAKHALVAELADCFRGEREFDRTLASWIDGQSGNASAFHRAVSWGSKPGDHSVMARRLASLTMNVDLRCTRCHDSYINGNGRQQDYWAFTAFLRQGIKRGPGGRMTIDEPSKTSKPLFYELPDGRQRVAEPGVATSWMKSEVEPIRNVRDWAQQLIGSPELARGVVNSLWQLVHGQPLRGRVVDPISAPHNETLDRLEEYLAEDLIDSRFDVARTLALIIASPATRCGVPEPLLPENALVADESEIREAMNAVDAFAAALPPRAQRPMAERLDVAMRAIGVKSELDSQGSPIVAQLGNPASLPGGNKPNPKATSAKTLSADFPGRADKLPVQWLKLIEDEKSQVEHLGYLAGRNQAPERVRQAAQLMQDAEVPKELLLHRVWWLLRP